MRYSYITADVFTDKRFTGNPLAVFPEAAGLDTATMQNIATEFNLSETVFVFPPDEPDHTFKLRIFTPAAELPFAGHPTVGSAYVLSTTGQIILSDGWKEIVFEEGVGLVPVRILAKHGRPVFSELTAARLPEARTESVSISEIAAALSIDPGDVLDGEFAPESVSCGVPCFFVGVQNRSVLARTRIQPAHWDKISDRLWGPQIFVYCFDPEREGSNVRARMFAPGLGVVEDPATGSAATGLAGYLGHRDNRISGSLHWVVEQGFEMGRPSILEVTADKEDNLFTAVRVGGASVLVSEGTIEV